MNQKLTAKGNVNMGLTHVEVALRRPGSSKRTYRDKFLVDSGATDSMAPGNRLRSIGIQPVGERFYELADGTKHKY